LQQNCVIRSPADITIDGLSVILGKDVKSFTVSSETSTWSSQFPIQVLHVDGTHKLLRLKICLGPTFGPSEVDYYKRDYVTLAEAPLVHCWDAKFERDIGYHILLDDLSRTHHNRRDAVPTLEFGFAVADALAQMHKHKWGNQNSLRGEVLNPYFSEIRQGILTLERATGQKFQQRAKRLEAALRERLSRSSGLTLLHGDLNPTNILTPITKERPVYFLDRQPFDWSITYGLALYDLAYFLIPWWPSEIRFLHEVNILKRWHQTLGVEGYTWQHVCSDWALAVEQCLHVPMQWCSKADTAVGMRWLWEVQLARVNNAIESNAINA
jgi:Phosphotransferase enzyme family